RGMGEEYFKAVERLHRRLSLGENP
ncbi:hypothetical protein NO1_2293, partial [Candidatus Termititenax aidoneus]